MRPPSDPYLRKGRPIINRNAAKETDISDLLNRGQQILLELDRQHQRLHDTVKDALRARSEITCTYTCTSIIRNRHDAGSV